MVIRLKLVSTGEILCIHNTVTIIFVSFDLKMVLPPKASLTKILILQIIQIKTLRFIWRLFIQRTDQKKMYEQHTLD